MSAPPAVTLPGGRVILTWWRDLAGLSPRRLWFAHLILHQVEVLVEEAVPRPLAPLASALLPRLSARAEPASLAALAGELSLEPGLLHAALADLSAQGLAAETPEGGWRATAGDVPAPAEATRRQRRTFVFSDARPPVYLPLLPGATAAVAPPPGWRFDLATLQACVARPEEWKREHGFPAEVRRVVPTGEDWRSVAVDQPGQALLLLAETGGGVVGLAARPDWALASEPVLRVPPDVVAALGGDPGPDAWRQAWQAWCQQRSLPGGEVEACKLEPVDHRLVVRAPGKLIDRLRAARSDALKGEAWLLAGTGRVRPTAVVELVEA